MSGQQKEGKIVLPDNLEEYVDQTKDATDRPRDLPRKSQRQRMLTEKGKKLHMDELKELLRRFEGS